MADGEIESKVRRPIPAVPDRAEARTLSDMMRHWARKFSLDTECCVPAIVVRYDRQSHVADVKILVNKLCVDGQSEDGIVVGGVNVWRWQCGGFLIDTPLFPGDTGWLIASDSKTVEAKTANSSIQSKSAPWGNPGDGNSGSQTPDDPSGAFHHKYSQGFFLPDSWGGVPVPDDDSLLIQQITRGGLSYGRLSLTGGGVLLFSSDVEDSSAVVIDLKHLGDNRLAAFREKTRVCGKEGGKLKTAKCFVLSTKDEPGEDIDAGYGPDMVTIDLTDEDENGEQLLQFRNVQKEKAADELLGLMRGSDEGGFEVVARKKVNVKWRTEYLTVGHGLGASGVLADTLSIDFKGKDDSLELAEFQTEDRDADTSVENDIDEWAADEIAKKDDGNGEEEEKESKEPKWMALVRDMSEDDKRLLYKEIGKIVTSIVFDDSAASSGGSSGMSDQPLTPPGIGGGDDQSVDNPSESGKVDLFGKVELMADDDEVEKGENMLSISREKNKLKFHSKGVDDQSCFKIVKKKRQKQNPQDPDEYYYTMVNLYYSKGEVMFELSDGFTDVDISEYVHKRIPGSSSTSFCPFVCLKVGALHDEEDSEESEDDDAGEDDAYITSYEDMETMVREQKKTGDVIRPLYKFDRNCKVEVDFRNMPMIQIVEVLDDEEDSEMV